MARCGTLWVIEGGGQLGVGRTVVRIGDDSRRVDSSVWELPQDFAFATGDTVTTVGELSDAAAKLRRDVECSKADSHAFATSAAELAADLNTAVAEIFAEALRNMSASQVEASVRIGSISASEAQVGAFVFRPRPPRNSIALPSSRQHVGWARIWNQVIGFLPECPATGCEALKHTIVAVVESGKEQPLMCGTLLAIGIFTTVEHLIPLPCAAAIQ